jgi:site-specific DNA recombinase
MRNNNATRAGASHEDYRERSYALRSFLKCGICGLRMHGRTRRNLTYYVCEVARRPVGLAPAGHPRMVFLAQRLAGEKIVEFLQNHVFGPERLPLLRAALASYDPEGDEAQNEVGRLRRELADLRTKVKRQMANLEAMEPGEELARDLRERLSELANLRAKKERELETADRALRERPDPQTAEQLLQALPLLQVDWDLLSEEDFRDLLKVLNFEARYHPANKVLTVRVALIPELLFPEDPAVPSLLFVPPAGFEPAASRSGGERSIH